ncbi:MAG: hypothetical protein F4097_04400, partial [Cenarchaeum sp. SB0672_bin_9]|nr:hypothetical protein [Cenarchaeum sp. SB0672_bin_9]
MSVENVYTINLGKALLSQSQHRAVRAINMIKEYARHHTGNPNIKIDPQLAEIIWSRGARRPPRKITVEIVVDDDTGAAIVMNYGLPVSLEIVEYDAAKHEKADDNTPRIGSGPADTPDDTITQKDTDDAAPTKDDSTSLETGPADTPDDTITQKDTDDAAPT